MSTNLISAKRIQLSVSPARQEVFLRELALHGVWSRAARVASPHSAYGASRSFRSLAERDPAFAAKASAAQEEADAAILSEIRRRAFGVEKPVYQKGVRIFDEFEERPATVTEFSDQLLLALARSRFKEFQDRKQVEVSGEVTHTHQRALQINPDWLVVLSGDQKAALRDILTTIARHRDEPLEIINQAIPEPKFIEAEFEEQRPEEWEEVRP